MSLSQQLFCSFEGAAFLARRCKYVKTRGSVVSPLDRWTYLRRALQFACANMWPTNAVSFWDS